jgi:transcriptional regulator GlxA family with amidase domain
MRIGVLVFEGVDLLDVGGPYEVFLTAGRLVARDGGEPPFEVVTVGTTGAQVTAYGGLGLVPHHGLDDCPPLDVVVVPGAIDIDGAVGDATLTDAIAQLTTRTGIAASVCTGAFLLAAVGRLDGRAWTTHWEDVDLLAGRLGADDTARGQRGVRWVDAGDVVTGAGLSSGVAMALHLVHRLAGRELAERTARQIDYEWRADGVADLGPSPAGSSAGAVGTPTSAPQ